MTERIRRGDAIEERTFYHTMFLTGVHADSVARIKLSGWLGVAAYFACGWCLFHGTRCQTAVGTGSMCFKGYSMPEPQLLGSKEGEPVSSVQIGTGLATFLPMPTCNWPHDNRHWLL